MPNILNLLSPLIGAAVLPVIYFDATKNKIGKVSDVKSFSNMSAGLWASSPGFICFALMGLFKNIPTGTIDRVNEDLILACFPSIFIGTIYLISRKKLIERAKSAPVDAGHRLPKIIMLAVLGIIVGLQRMN